MNATDRRKRASLADTIEPLPSEARTGALVEIEGRIASLSQSALTAERRSIVANRLATPRRRAAPEAVRALLDRFDPGQ